MSKLSVHAAPTSDIKQERPREKLLRHGIKTLEDHELVALLLGRGNKKEDVFALSKRLLKGFDQEELLNINEVDTFQKNFKVGFVQACQLMAAVELGKRFFKKTPFAGNLRNAEEAYKLVQDMQSLKKEHVRGLYLNSRYRLIHEETISIGSLDTNIIHPREIFRPAIEYGAYALILAHNHPTGDPTPSAEDLAMTKRLVKVGKLLQIPLLDHLIVGCNAFTSLNKENLM